MPSHIPERLSKESSSGSEVPKSNILRIRIILVIAVTAITLLAVGFSFSLLSEADTKLFKSQYKAMVSDGASIAVERSNGIKLLTKTASILYKFTFPDKKQWPNVYHRGFDEFAKALTDLSFLDVPLVGFFPIVRQEELPSFEEYAEKSFSKEPSLVNRTIDGISSGVYSIDSSNDLRYHDTTGETRNYKSPYDIMTPLLQVQNMSVHQKGLLFNSHSAPSRGMVQDDILECVSQISSSFKENVLLQEDIALGIKSEMKEDQVSRYFAYHNAVDSCSGTTGIIETQHIKSIKLSERDRARLSGAQTAMFFPIILANDPHHPVGFTGILFNWSSILLGILPDYAAGVIAVVEAISPVSTTTISYLIENGKVHYYGQGDSHDPRYSSFVKRTALFDSDNILSRRVHYKISFYPTAEFEASYRTNKPIIASIMIICIAVVLSLIFILYDLAVREQVTAKEAILDTKRRFVRFISHEVRTPLNTVKVGSQIILQEQKDVIERMQLLLADQSEGRDRHSVLQSICNIMVSWLDIASDVLANAETAVTVLDDLLNYDKIEMGTMRLEFHRVNICQLVSNVRKHFRLSAAKKVIEMFLEFEGFDGLYSQASQTLQQSFGVDILSAGSYDEDDISFRALIVFGDMSRLAQVIRNLISNALKFTTEKGQVHITCTLNPVGLTTEGDKQHIPLVAVAKKLNNDNADNSRDSVHASHEVVKDLIDNYVQAGSLIIAVTDSGEGMTESQLQSLFNEGIQFNPGKLQAGGGSGLGLFITKGLVEQHGGRIWVSSEGLKKGSTFYVELPVYTPRHIAEVMTSKKSDEPKPVVRMDSSNNQFHSSSITSGSSDGCVLFGQETIEVITSIKEVESDKTDLALQDPDARKLLLVDDATSNRKMVKRLLTAKGFVCYEAKDGLEALNIYTEHVGKGEDFDTILMDYEMPEMNGPDATYELRNKYNCRCSIVGLTGNLLAQDVEYFLEKGADKVIGKPLKFEELEQYWHDRDKA